MISLVEFFQGNRGGGMGGCKVKLCGSKRELRL